MPGNWGQISVPSMSSPRRRPRKNTLEKTTQGMDVLITGLSIVSGLCSALIIATTLSVGVQERLRQFGQLRCIGAARRQLVTIVAADALLLATLGVILGLVIGTIGSRVLIGWFPRIFTAGCHLEWRSLFMAIGNGVLSTAIGAAVPAWQIARVTPMEAVAVAGRPARTRGVWLAGAIGLLLLTTQALMWNFIPNRDVRFWTYVSAGIPFIFCGYCLLAPGLILLLQHVAASVLGFVLGVRSTLLRQAWSQTPWRAGGMIAALMIGVVMYATVRQRSEGIIASWDFPKVFPDVVMFTHPGRPLADVMRLRNAPGVTAVTGVGVGAVKLERRVFGTGRVLESGNTRFGAIDVDTFRKMVELEFIQGDPQSAMDRLKQGRAVLVSQEFHVARGINTGDMLAFKSGDRAVDFEVAGVVKSSGIEMMQNFFDFPGNFHDEAVSSVIGSLEDGGKYFGIGSVNVALVNMDLHGRTPEQAVQELRDRANGQGGLKRSNDALTNWLLGASSQPASEPATAPASASATQGDAEGRGALSAFIGLPDSAWRLNWQTTSIIEIKDFIGGVIARAVRALSAIAIAAMCVASLGVANMVIASMQSRSFEFGVLRAVGTGRGQLVRMVLAEITLVSLVAGTLGSIAGLHLTFMATRVDRLLVGYVTPFVTREMLPHMLMHVAVAVGVTVLLGWLAAVVPAVRSAFRPQRELLAEGRA